MYENVQIKTKSRELSLLFVCYFNVVTLLNDIKKLKACSKEISSSV